MFKTTLKIALASLLRRRTRSVLLVCMISVSLWGLLVMEGIYDGMIGQMISNAIRSDSGHISIFARGYRLEPDLSRWIDDPASVENFLAGDTRVKSYVERLEQDGLVATAHASRGVRVIGIDPAGEDRHGRLAGYLYRGEYGFGGRGRGAMIGFKLADKLQVRIGSKIIVSAQDHAGEISSLSFRVRGILKANNLGLDENAVFLARDRTRELLSMERGVSQVAVLLKDEKEIHALQDDLRKRFAGLGVLCWDELYPALLQAKVMMEGFNLVTNLLIFGAAALGIFGVLLVSVLERLREFGIMLAIGTRFTQLCEIILIESCVLGLLGFAIGSLLGLATLWYFRTNGLDLSVFNEAFAEFGMDAVTYAVIQPGYFLTALAAVVLAVFFSVLVPLRILKRTRPIEAINSI